MPPLTQSAADEWARYRSRHPLHMQEIVFLAPDEAGARLLIISEPPPEFPRDPAAVRNLLERIFGQGRVEDVAFRKHPIMVDGWTRDVTQSLF